MACVKILLDKTPPTRESPAPHNIRSILFLRQDGKIGDYVVSAFALRAIKQQAPHIRIGVLCNHKNRDIFSGNPDIDALHETRHKSTWNYWQTARQLVGQYDVVIEPTLFLRPRDLLLLRCLCARHIVGLDKGNYRLFNINIPDKNQHFSEIYRQALLLLGFRVDNTHFRLPEDSHAAQKVALFLAQHHCHDYIAVNFFGAANARRFDEAHIRALMDALCQALPAQRWVWLTYPEITPFLMRIARDYPQVCLMENTETIHDSTEIIRHCRLVISPDTAIVHIAASLGKPVLGLYPDNPQNTANWLPNIATRRVLFFRQHIHDISVSEIVRALHELQSEISNDV